MERIEVLKTYKIFIGGQFPRTESGRYYPLKLKNNMTVNVSLSSRKDFRNAVVAARGAFSVWSSRAAFNRGQILYRIAEMLEGRKEQFLEELQQLGYTAAKAKKEIENILLALKKAQHELNQVFVEVGVGAKEDKSNQA